MKKENNWDDKTQDILTKAVTKIEGEDKFTYLSHQNRNTEKWKCEVIKNGELFGAVNYFDDTEQVVAWFRLVIGDYPSNFRGKVS
jgi:hypothetical protein